MQTFMPRSDQVEAVQVHNLVPGCDEVTHELFLRIVLRIDLGQGAQLRVGAEYKVNSGGCPLGFACLAVAPFERIPRIGRGLPHGAHVEQVDEEVVGEDSDPSS